MKIFESYFMNLKILTLRPQISFNILIYYLNAII